MFATNNEHGPVFTHTRKLDEVSLVHGKTEANNVSPSLKHPLFFLALFLSIYENLFSLLHCVG